VLLYHVHCDLMRRHQQLSKTAGKIQSEDKKYLENYVTSNVSVVEATAGVNKYIYKKTTFTLFISISV